MSYSAELKERYRELWEASVSHPFVNGVGDGSLPLDNFRYYMGQDFLFLVDMCRAMASAVAKSDTLEDMQYFSQGLDATLNSEMSLHTGYCEQLGITEMELRQTKPSPSTLAYTGHLIRVASQGDPGEIAAAMLPCSWTYAEIGLMLFDRGLPQDQPLYWPWIEMYASEGYVESAERMKAFVDRCGASAGPSVLARMDSAFDLALRYEYLFWEAALAMEEWAF